jgi:hypothetical protein
LSPAEAEEAIPADEAPAEEVSTDAPVAVDAEAEKE